MTNGRSLLDGLRSNDQDTRLDAQASLARWLREEPDPEKALKRGLLALAPQAFTERQRRIFGALLGDIAVPESALLLVVAGNSEEIHGTVARRALRRFLDSASPLDEARVLSGALIWCAFSHATEQLIVFVCERIMEAAVKRPTTELCVVQKTLEKLVAHQRRRTFIRGGRATDAHFAETLESLRPLLPAATLPIPSHGSPAATTLPIPAEGESLDPTDLLAPSMNPGGEAPKKWWRR